MNSRKPVPYLLFAMVACLIPIIAQGNEYYLHIYIVCVINVILASSLRIIASTGQMSIGQAGFMGIGAYTSAIMVVKYHFPVYVGLLMGGVAATTLAALIGYPLARVRTIYFAMVTMFLGEIIRLAIYEWRDLTGGSTGLIGIPRPTAFSLFGIWNIDFATRIHFCYLALVLLLLMLLVFHRMEQSQLGTALAAIGQEEAVASSVGINVARYKVISFCIGSFFTGLAGGLYAHFMTVLNPDTFNIFRSLYILIYVVVGGRMFSGPIVGAVVLTLIPEVFGTLKEYQPFVFVSVVFSVVFFLPGGLADLPGRIKLLMRKGAKRGIHA